MLVLEGARILDMRLSRQSENQTRLNSCTLLATYHTVIIAELDKIVAKVKMWL